MHGEQFFGLLFLRGNRFICQVILNLAFWQPDRPRNRELHTRVEREPWGACGVRAYALHPRDCGVCRCRCRVPVCGERTPGERAVKTGLCAFSTTQFLSAPGGDEEVMVYHFIYLLCNIATKQINNIGREDSSEE